MDETIVINRPPELPESESDLERRMRELLLEELEENR